MSEMMIYPLFAMVSMMSIRGVEISSKQNVQNKLQFGKVWNHCQSYVHCGRYVGNDDLNYVCNG